MYTYTYLVCPIISNGFQETNAEIAHLHHCIQYSSIFFDYIHSWYSQLYSRIHITTLHQFFEFVLYLLLTNSIYVLMETVMFKT